VFSKGFFRYCNWLISVELHCYWLQTCFDAKFTSLYDTNFASKNANIPYCCPSQYINSISARLIGIRGGNFPFFTLISLKFHFLKKVFKSVETAEIHKNDVIL
jgi:hypothetical protein